MNASLCLNCGAMISPEEVEAGRVAFVPIDGDGRPAPFSCERCTRALGYRAALGFASEIPESEDPDTWRPGWSAVQLYSRADFAAAAGDKATAEGLEAAAWWTFQTERRLRQRAAAASVTNWNSRS